MRRFLRDIWNTIPFVFVLGLVVFVVMFFVGGPVPSESLAMTEVKAAEALEPTDTARETQPGEPDVQPETAVLSVPVQTEAHQTAPEEPEPEPAQPEPAKTKATSPYYDLVSQLSDEDVDILTRLVYHESRGEGGLAVIEVVFNRMLDKRFPNTLQGVVYAKNQFEPAPNLYTWSIKEPAAYAKCEQEVKEAMSPDYQPILPSYYVFFNNYSAGKTEDYCWQGGNVFFGEYNF